MLDRDQEEASFRAEAILRDTLLPDVFTIDLCDLVDLIAESGHHNPFKCAAKAFFTGDLILA